MTKLELSIFRANKRNEKLYGISLKIPMELKKVLYDISEKNQVSVNSLIVESLKLIFMEEEETK
ncbi:MAG: hypothetical protein WC665_04430 [Sulfurimonas sp.]|jgi:hypothetical protein